MPSVQSSYTTPASTITTTTETLAANIPALPLSEPGGAPQSVIVRFTIYLTTGTSTAQMKAQLRLGQNNTTTNPIGQPIQTQSGAGAGFAISGHFVDPAGSVNLPNSGYSLTITQAAASANGTINAVFWEVDYSSH